MRSVELDTWDGTKFILYYVLKTSLHLPVPQELKSDTNDVCETRTVFTDSGMCKCIVTSCSAHIVVHPQCVLRHLFLELHVTIKWGNTFLRSTICHDSKHTATHTVHSKVQLWLTHQGIHTQQILQHALHLQCL